jgi:putative oxidoreductase
MGALFLSAAAMKLSGAEMEVAAFNQVGLGQWFRYFVGALEVIGGIAVLMPRFSIIGAGVLLSVDIGAFGGQVMVLHRDWIPPGGHSRAARSTRPASAREAGYNVTAPANG